jgi:hypothetical protein
MYLKIFGDISPVDKKSIDLIQHRSISLIYVEQTPVLCHGEKSEELKFS